MRPWRDIIFGEIRAKKKIKKLAHYFTFLSVLLCVFSPHSVLYILYSGRTPTGTAVAILSLVIHAAAIGLAIHFWKTEKESEVELRDDEVIYHRPTKNKKQN